MLIDFLYILVTVSNTKGSNTGEQIWNACGYISWAKCSDWI